MSRGSDAAGTARALPHDPANGAASNGDIHLIGPKNGRIDTPGGRQSGGVLTGGGGSFPHSCSPFQVRFPHHTIDTLKAIARIRRRNTDWEIPERNARFFDATAEKLDTSANAMKIGLGCGHKELDQQIEEDRRATAASALDEKLAG